MSGESTLSLHVAKKLPGFSLDAELDVNGRGVLAFFGRSGAGKSCMVNMIAGSTA